jgi:hypothetical protein
MKSFIALVLPLLILGSAIAFATVVPHGKNMPRQAAQLYAAVTVR